MLICAAVSFSLVLKEVNLLILRPTKHTSVLILHRVMPVSDREARSRAILVFFRLDPAPPRFRHARHSGLAVVRRRGRCPGLLYLIRFGKAFCRRRGGTFLLAVCENKRAAVDVVLVGKGIYFERFNFA